MQSRRFGLTAPGLIKLRDLAVELLELVKTNMPKKSGEQNAWKFEKAHSLLHKVRYRMRYHIYFIKENTISHTISHTISYIISMQYRIGTLPKFLGTLGTLPKFL